jgi:hypothetical protein
MSECQLCHERTPEDMAFFAGGSQPRCAFPDGVFVGDNWNCETAGQIRTICTADNYGVITDELPIGVSYQWDEDENYATIQTARIGDCFGVFMYVQWYKNRGRTDIIAIIDNTVSRPATEQECRAVIAYYQKRELWPNGHPDDEEDNAAIGASI